MSSRAYSCPRPSAVRDTPPRTWNPLRRFCPLLPAWWAHIKNQRILNGYITGIIRARWDVIQKERSLAAAAICPGASSVFDANGAGGSANGKVSSTAGRRKRDILDKVLDALEPGEWGTAAVLQVSTGTPVVSHRKSTSPHTDESRSGDESSRGCSWFLWLLTVSVCGQGQTSVFSLPTRQWRGLRAPCPQHILRDVA